MAWDFEPESAVGQYRDTKMNSFRYPCQSIMFLVRKGVVLKLGWVQHS